MLNNLKAFALVLGVAGSAVALSSAADAFNVFRIGGSEAGLAWTSPPTLDTSGVSGFVSWTLMLTGVAGAGLGLRAARRSPAPAGTSIHSNNLSA